MFSSDEVRAITHDLAARFGGEAKERQDSIEFAASHGPKKVCLDWPKYDLAEVWATFYEGDMTSGIYQDWFECMDEEDKTEFVSYIHELLERFFSQRTRVARRGFLLRRSVLEFESPTGWRDLLDPSAT